MTRQYKFYWNYMSIAGVILVGFVLAVLTYELARRTPCLCQLVLETAGIALDGWRAVCVLADTQVIVSAGLWENLGFLQILARVGAYVWPFLSVLAV